MSTTKPTLIDKRDNHVHPSIKKMTDKGMMYISTPKEIDGIIKTVPKGKLITTKYVTSILTKKYGVDFTCPLTTGIFSSICAGAAEEELSLGKKDVTPYWRIVKPKGKLMEKYLGKFLPQREHLEAEGYEIVTGKNGKGEYVKDYEKYIIG